MPVIRKLRLNKTTVRRLEPREMLDVVGGKPTTDATGWYSCGGTCETLCPGSGCNDPTIRNTCGC